MRVSVRIRISWKLINEITGRKKTSRNKTSQMTGGSASERLKMASPFQRPLRRTTSGSQGAPDVLEVKEVHPLLDFSTEYRAFRIMRSTTWHLSQCA